MDINEMSKLKENFWGKPNQRAFLPKKRKEMIANIFTICEANKVIKYYYLYFHFYFYLFNGRHVLLPSLEQQGWQSNL